MTSLRLLDGAHWEGAAIPGERLGDLLSALALRPSGASDQALVEELWADEMPANPTKALQVLVSRVRSACGPGVVERYDGGYRLRLDRGDVDVWLVADLTAAAERAVAAGDAGAVDLTARAEALLAGAADTDPGDGPRGRLMQSTRALESRVRRVRGLALAARGDAAGALPLLLRSHAEAPDDVATWRTGSASTHRRPCNGCTVSCSPPTTRSAPGCAGTPRSCSGAPGTWTGSGPRWRPAA